MTSISDLVNEPTEPPEDSEESEAMTKERQERPAPLDTPPTDTSAEESIAPTTPDTPLDPANAGAGGTPGLTPPSAEPVGDPVLNAILSKIVPVKSKERRRNLKVLIYSDPGCGKTVLAGMAPDNLFIDTEDGLISLDNHPDLISNSVYAYPYKSFVGFEAMVQKLNEAPPELAHIKTVTIDTISELHKKGLQEITDREYWKSPMSNNRYVAETEHHMENNEHIRRLVSSLRDLDRNLILLSHARTVEPKNKPAKTYPDFSEKLANALAGIVDIVAYMYLKEVNGEVVRVLQLKGDGVIVAKTRIGGYPNEIVNPTWDDLWTAFEKASIAHDEQAN